VNGLKLLRRQQEANGTKGAYIFINERGQLFGRMGIGRMVERAGEAAGLPQPCRRCNYSDANGAARGLGLRCQPWACRPRTAARARPLLIAGATEPGLNRGIDLTRCRVRALEKINKQPAPAGDGVPPRPEGARVCAGQRGRRPPCAQP
jgi:hypothetical protein